MAVQKHLNVGVIKVRRAVPCKHCHFGVDDVKTLNPLAPRGPHAFTGSGPHWGLAKIQILTNTVSNNIFYLVRYSLKSHCV